MFDAPATPQFPAGDSATSSMIPRYEDVTMHGHLMALAAPSGLAGLWRDVLVSHPGAINSLAQGIVPILTRMTIRTMPVPIRIDRPFETFNGFQLAHDLAGSEVSRLFMNIWCEIRGVSGRLGRADGGERTLAGTVFAEHTFTRLLAPPEQRKVTRLAVPGYPELPPVRHAAPSPTTAGDAPDGATWLDELAPDTQDYVFTLDQTDQNQHVNSLVYVRLFIEAVSRRLAAAGKPLRVRTDAVDIAYRKPCFAGDRVRAHLRLFQLGDRLGAAGQVLGDDGKPRCFVRVALSS